MEQAIFLVTSLAGVKKLSFKQKVRSLMDDQINVVIVLAMIQFGDYELARQTVLSQFHVKQVSQIKLVTLASLMADSTGVPVTDAEQFQTDFEQLPVRRFNQADSGKVTLRYIQAGEIVAEVVEDSNEQPLLMTRFEDHQPVQAAVYEAGRQFGLLDYQAGQLSQALLLNQTGQMVYRFIRRTQPVSFAYTMGRSAKLKFTNLLAEQNDEKRLVYQASEQQLYYEVVNYSNYDRFESVYAFYAQLLQGLVAADDGLFIDLNDNPQLTTYLPQQLIFNY